MLSEGKQDRFLISVFDGSISLRADAFDSSEIVKQLEKQMIFDGEYLLLQKYRFRRCFSEK